MTPRAAGWLAAVSMVGAVPGRAWSRSVGSGPPIARAWGLMPATPPRHCLWPIELPEPLPLDPRT